MLDDLDQKDRARALGAAISADELIAHGLRYERFRLETFLSSGVSPKRYFGFFDEQGDTALQEVALRTTIQAAVPLINDYARRENIPVSLTDKEVAVTFLAEGGALLLTDLQAELEAIDPVQGIGLDSFRLGFARHARLIEILDAGLKTGLGKLIVRDGDRELLVRPMTFREAVLGTAVMYLYEKELAARMRPPEAPMSSLSLDRQFIATSLVYNSGLAFSDERIDQVLRFDTAGYLAKVNEQNRGRRAWLPVLDSPASRRLLESGAPIPRQLTSWSAVYHVLQRTGAWTALARFSDVFDARGMFTRGGGGKLQ